MHCGMLHLGMGTFIPAVFFKTGIVYFYSGSLWGREFSMQKNFDPKEYCGNSCQSVLNGATPLCKAVSVFFLLVAIAYDISPVDLAPDAVPIFGWMDDIGVTAIALLNLYQRFAKNQYSSVVRIVRIVKWILVSICVLTALTIVTLFLMGIVLIQ